MNRKIKELEARKASLVEELQEITNNTDAEQQLERERQQNLERDRISLQLAVTSARETQTLQTLVGQTVVSAYYKAHNEGIYVLNFSNGTGISFSAIGDDATCVTVEIGPTADAAGLTEERPECG